MYFACSVSLVTLHILLFDHSPSLQFRIKFSGQSIVKRVQNERRRFLRLGVGFGDAVMERDIKKIFYILTHPITKDSMVTITTYLKLLSETIIQNYTA